MVKAQRRFFRFSVLVLVGLVVLALSPSRNVQWSNTAWNSNEPPNPAENITPNPNFAPTTVSGPVMPPCYNYPTTQQCDEQVLQAINNARADEGLSPLSIPSNFSTFPDYEKQFIIVNLERTSRGEPPIAGVIASLNSVAEAAATQYHSDPVITSSVTFSYVSNWSGSYAGSAGALASDYGYMYNDGWGGSPSNTSNLACTSPTAPGCWGHRDNILWNPGVPLSMGAAMAPWGNGYYNSTELIAETTPSSPSGYLYTWTQYLQSQSPANQCSPAIGTAVAAASDPNGGGWVAGTGGTVATQGGAPCYGSLAGQSLNASIVGIAATPDGKGYWLVASDGGVFSFGDAVFYGSMGGKPLNKPIVGMAATPDGKGYWLVASDGGIFTFGDATFDGSMGGKPLNQPIVGMASDQATGGYWEVASDGGIFSFGAPFFGSMGGKPLNKPIVGMDALANGLGYRFVAADGGVFDFGAATFLGSMGGQALSGPIVGMAAEGSGYWLVGGDGSVFSY